MSRGTADLRAQEATQVDVSLAEKLIALILLLGPVLSLFYVWDYYDTGFASGYASGYVYIRWFIGGVTESLLLWPQHGAVLVSLLAVGTTFLVARRPGYILDDQARRPERS